MDVSEFVFCLQQILIKIFSQRFEDFAECFPLYVEEDKNGASATFNSISDYIEAQDFVWQCSVHLIFSAYLLFAARFG